MLKICLLYQNQCLSRAGPNVSEIIICACLAHSEGSQLKVENPPRAQWPAEEVSEEEEHS